MKQELKIKGRFPDLNSYINAERRSKFAGAAIKKEWTEIAMREAQAQHMKKMKSPVAVSFTWWVKDRKRDKDGISFGAKFILDGLVQAHILKNDGWNDIHSIAHFFLLDDANLGEHVTVQLIEETKV